MLLFNWFKLSKSKNTFWVSFWSFYRQNTIFLLWQKIDKKMTKNYFMINGTFFLRSISQKQQKNPKHIKRSFLGTPDRVEGATGSLVL